MPFVRFLYGWRGEYWLEWGVEGIWCAVVLGEGDWGSAIPHPPLLRGDLASGIPHSAAAGGFGLRHSSYRCRGGLRLRHSPSSSPEGPLQQLEKSSQSAIWRPVFFCTPSIPYASKLATVCPGTKKALKRCLRAFFRCCGERGIRTPGTVTRTSV